MEFLNIEQIALRLQVSRTTVFDWLKKGALEEGTHYFKIGRVIRFAWDAEVFLKINRKANTVNCIPNRKTVPKTKKRRLQRSIAAIDLDY